MANKNRGRPQQTNSDNPFLQVTRNLSKRAKQQGIEGSIPSIYTLPVHIAIDAMFRTEQDLFQAGQAQALMEVLTEEWMNHYHTIAEWRSLTDPGMMQYDPEKQEKAVNLAGALIEAYFRNHPARVEQFRLRAIEIGKGIKNQFKKPAEMADLAEDASRLGPEVKTAMISVTDTDNRITWATWPLRDTFTRASKTNSFYIDVYGKGQAGKTNFGYNAAGLALGQDMWLYTNLVPAGTLKKKYPRARWFVIHKASDLLIDTPEMPSILRIHIENVRRLLSGYYSEIGSVIEFDEAKMGLEGNSNAIEGRAHAAFMQVKRHIGNTGVIYLGVHEQKTYFESTFETMKIQCRATPVNKFDELGRQMSSYRIEYTTVDDPETTYTVYDIPKATLRPPEIGVDISVPVEFDIDFAEMFREMGEPPRVLGDGAADLQLFIAQMQDYIWRTANYARRKQGMAIVRRNEMEDSITQQLSEYNAKPIFAQNNDASPQPGNGIPAQQPGMQPLAQIIQQKKGTDEENDDFILK